MSLETRKQIKKSKPNYKRAQSNQYAKLKNKSSWRRPKGKGNKDRRNRKGHVGMLKIGYKSPKSVRGLNKDGLREIIIRNISDLEKVNKGDIAIISSKVGGKKKIDILKAAQSKKITVGNVKDITKALESLKKEKKVVKKKEEPSKSKEEKPKTEVKKEESEK